MVNGQRLKPVVTNELAPSLIESINLVVKFTMIRGSDLVWLKIQNLALVGMQPNIFM